MTRRHASHESGVTEPRHGAEDSPHASAGLRTGAVYIYGLINAEEDRGFGPIGLEFRGEPARVYTLLVDGVAAVVSRYEMGEGTRVLPLRKNLAPHHQVLRAVMATTTIVPMAFGHVAAGEREVLALLRRRRGAIEDQLARVDGKVEMSLKVKWDVDNIFDYFVKADSELKAERDRLFGRSGPPNRSEMLALGQLFERSLERQREEQIEKVKAGFLPAWREVSELPARDELTVANLAFLVPRATVADFERRVYQIAAGFPAEYIFAVGGPLPPFSFVNLNLSGA